MVRMRFRRGVVFPDMTSVCADLINAGSTVRGVTPPQRNALRFAETVFPLKPVKEQTNACILTVVDLKYELVFCRKSSVFREKAAEVECLQSDNPAGNEYLYITHAHLVGLSSQGETRLYARPLFKQSRKGLEVWRSTSSSLDTLATLTPSRNRVCHGITVEPAALYRRICQGVVCAFL